MLVMLKTIIILKKQKISIILIRLYVYEMYEYNTTKAHIIQRQYRFYTTFHKLSSISQ